MWTAESSAVGLTLAFAGVGSMLAAGGRPFHRLRAAQGSRRQAGRVPFAGCDMSRRASCTLKAQRILVLFLAARITEKPVSVLEYEQIKGTHTSYLSLRNVVSTQQKLRSVK